MVALNYTRNDTPNNGHLKYALICLLILMVEIITGVKGQKCVKELSDNYGIIMSESYPKHNVIFQPCRWNITMEGKTIILIIRDMDLSIKKNGKCIENFLFVSGGDNYVGPRRLCDSTDVTKYVSSRDYMILQIIPKTFSSPKRGFFAEYHASDVVVKSRYIFVEPYNQSKEFVIKCDTSTGNSTQNVKSYSLSRLSSQKTFCSTNQSSYTVIAVAESTGVTLVNKGTSGAEASGSIKTFLQVTFKQATCKDSGIYKCVSTYTAANQSEKTYEEYTNVYISLDPQPAHLNITPVKQCYAYGIDVTLQCSIQIGSVLNGIEKELLWESRKSDDSDWKPYNYDVTVRHPPKSLEECQFIQVSTLKFRVDQSHSGLQFRCIIEEYGNLPKPLGVRAHNDSPIVAINETRDTKFPGKVQIWVEPVSPYFTVSSTISLNCQGSVGSEVGVETLWKWEYKDINKWEWIEYLQTNNMQISMIKNSTNECVFIIETSTLTLKLTKDDNNREYRCYIVKKNAAGQEFPYRVQGASYRLRVQTFGTEASLDLDSAGGYIGLAIGAFLLVSAGVISVCMFWRRREKSVTTAAVVIRMEPLVMHKKEGRTLIYMLQMKIPEPQRKVSTSVDPPSLIKR